MNNTWVQFLFLLFVLVPLVLYILTLQNTLKIISPENRRMRPADVWLIVIPVLGTFWQLYVVNKLSESIKGECTSLAVEVQTEKPTFLAGTIYCFANLLFLVPEVRVFASVLVMISWITYWMQVSNYKKIITETRRQSTGSV